MNGCLPVARWLVILQQFTQRQAGCRFCSQVEARLQRFEQCWQPARLVEVFHVAVAGGFAVDQQGDLLGDFVEILQRQSNPGPPGNCCQMNDHIGGPAHSHEDFQRVLE